MSSEDDKDQKLLELQKIGRNLELQNYQLRQELKQLRSDLKFNFHKVDMNEKKQVKYVLTHSQIHIEKREAEINFLENPKRLILQGIGYCYVKQNTSECYTFSYTILLTDELKQDPKIIATDTKIEIIFDKNQDNSLR
ncbi:unnamed protein product [Paramecium sonneborni]|uniref:Uncharacterized protein n=1 Tax=Paramecium sonneborni TaxID=65129 RepID=A0A8S1RN26_9CILI|nr:unnamed protein product [Paramecium sonneborni]